MDWLPLIIYVVGLPFGFFLAAAKKEEWWYANPAYHQDGGGLAVLVTLFWFIVVPIFLVYHFLALCYTKFIRMIEGFLSLQKKTANYMQKFKERKPKPRKRVIVSVATEAKQAGYREQAPKPCIACGVPTSLDQSGMECVESAEAQYLRLDI